MTDTSFPFGYNLSEMPVQGWPGYFVTPYGSIISKKRSKAVVLVQQATTKGYLYVSLKNGKRRWCPFVHRLVLSTFGREGLDGEQVRHIDNNPRNNQLNNLRWGTCQDNIDDREISGHTVRGSRHKRAKLSDAQRAGLIQMRISRGLTFREIARRCGVSAQRVQQIVAAATREVR